MFDRLFDSRLRYTVGPFCCGMLAGTVTVWLLMLIVALVLKFTNLPQESLPALGTGIVTVGGFVGALVTSLITRRKGLINGIICGVVFAAIVLVVGKLIANGAGTPFVSRLLCLLGASVIGGVLGVNIRSHHHRKTVRTYLRKQ